jgi:hypothetical protein
MKNSQLNSTETLFHMLFKFIHSLCKFKKTVPSVCLISMVRKELGGDFAKIV